MEIVGKVRFRGEIHRGVYEVLGAEKTHPVRVQAEAPIVTRRVNAQCNGRKPVHGYTVAIGKDLELAPACL
ncbi:hypothetical protein GCT13_29170 [Paraburkholderia sp. CNPSo 3157]|uniref:Uncharacterized protein n=1 Tax=Paraburkholderia franconis TaxID=2654983 RepID=A0A7X1NF45_9BURK|nr:hypothetical protein [Paraburkholderia franconis]MPW20829.1 hypothetical protein [Paraburkholderia franconis]